MTTVTSEVLQDELPSYLRRVGQGERVVVMQDGKAVAALVSLDEVGDQDEEARLAALEARGLIIRPQVPKDQERFQGPFAPTRGKRASEIVIEDRR